MLQHPSCVFIAGSASSSNESKRLGDKLQHGVTAALADLRTLAQHPVYILNVAGTAVYTGTYPARSLYAPAQMCLEGKDCHDTTYGSVVRGHHPILYSLHCLLAVSGMYMHLLACTSIK